jgi:hypothetical protein
MMQGKSKCYSKLGKNWREFVIGGLVIGDSLLSYWLLGEGLELFVGGSVHVFGYLATPRREIL